ncbi:MAG: ribosomal protein S18-alanine N-acetyltransferase [Halobacteriaceae archaeon]
MTVVDPSDAGVSVRPAERGDLSAVVHIERRVFPQPWPYRAFERHLGSPGFLVAEAASAGDALSGYVVADVIPGPGVRRGHVKDIAVAEDRRGRGIGSVLLGMALDVLAAHEAERVKLEVRRANEAAQSLYRSFGFEHARTIPAYYDDGEDALVLERDAGGE